MRRLLENGANTSFVHALLDERTPVSKVVTDPITAVEASGGSPHPRIPLPRELYGAERANSSGIDMANEHRLASLSSALLYESINETLERMALSGVLNS